MTQPFWMFLIYLFFSFTLSPLPHSVDCIKGRAFRLGHFFLQCTLSLIESAHKIDKILLFKPRKNPERFRTMPGFLRCVHFNQVPENSWKMLRREIEFLFTIVQNCSRSGRSYENATIPIVIVVQVHLFSYKKLMTFYEKSR